MKNQRAGASAMPEISGQRGSSGPCAGASVGCEPLGGADMEQGKITIMSKIMSKIGIGFDCERQITPETAAKAPQLPKIPESRCDFILHDADGELLMRHDCPEILGEG